MMFRVNRAPLRKNLLPRFGTGGRRGLGRVLGLGLRPLPCLGAGGGGGGGGILLDWVYEDSGFAKGAP